MELKWYSSSLLLSTDLRSILKGNESGEILLNTTLESNGQSCIYPFRTNLFIADEERVRDSTSFKEIIGYYETKVVPSESEARILKIIDNSLEETRVNQPTDITGRFSTLLEQVYLDLPGLSSISKFPYWVIHKISESDKQNQGYLSFLLEFISLCSLSTRVAYDDSSRNYIFIYPYMILLKNIFIFQI